MCQIVYNRQGELAGVPIDVTRHAGFASKHSRLHPAHETEALRAAHC